MQTLTQGQRYGGDREAVAMQTRRYTEIPKSAVKTIKDISAIYGSQSRTLQVATEILIRQKRPIKLKYHVAKKGGKGETASFKLLPRTIELIDRLAPIYGTRGKVIAASAQILKHPA